MDDPIVSLLGVAATKVTVLWAHGHWSMLQSNCTEAKGHPNEICMTLMLNGSQERTSGSLFLDFSLLVMLLKFASVICLVLNYRWKDLISRFKIHPPVEFPIEVHWHLEGVKNTQPSQSLSSPSSKKSTSNFAAPLGLFPCSSSSFLPQCLSKSLTASRSAANSLASLICLAF
jgi:hypothetical protein